MPEARSLNDDGRVETCPPYSLRERQSVCVCVYGRKREGGREIGKVRAGRVWKFPSGGSQSAGEEIEVEKKVVRKKAAREKHFLILDFYL